MPNDIEALRARLRSDADYLEKIYGPDHQIVADLREAATALDSLAARIQELEGALRAIAEGNLGDGPGEANYARIKQVARASLNGGDGNG